MKKDNQTIKMYFVLKGISDIPELQVPIFLLILIIYLITFGGNMTILLLITLDHQLHTPMYFFLGNLSVIDISSTTIILQKLLSTFISGDNTISFLACMIQMFIYLSLVGVQVFILAVMSYDRYAAICNPLRYPMVMNFKVFTLLASFCWVFSFIDTLPYLVLLSGYSCYRSNIINHFYCDIVPLIKLICNDTTILGIFIFIETLFLGFASFVLTFTSYIFIIIAILKINSRTGRRKTFYTCSSHLSLVFLLYTTLFCLYLRPNSKDNLEANKLFSLFNTVAVPLLNPLIYSLKNKDVKSALRRLLRRCIIIA